MTAVLLATACCKDVEASMVYVGSWQVDLGQYWGTNPPVYSGQEAAAFLFGGLASDYAISVNSSLDSNTITHTAWYDGWGDHVGRIFPEWFHYDVGNDGYQFPGGGGTAYSALVSDGLFGPTFTNYAWRIDSAAVPEPSSLALLGLGGCAGFVRVRRRSKANCAAS
jgi:hypothetical protein